MANMIKVGDTFVNLDKVEYIENVLRVMDFSEGDEPPAPHMANELTLVFGENPDAEGYRNRTTVRFRDAEADALRSYLDKISIDVMPLPSVVQTITGPGEWRQGYNEA